MKDKMTGKKIYLQPKGMLLNAIYDIAELQKGRKLTADSNSGLICFTVSMYGRKWDLCYTVTDLGKNRCSVELAIEGELSQKKRQLLYEFALIDAMLVGSAKIEVDEKQITLNDTTTNQL